ncbi:hypothetical protein D3C76_445390 [compost metagenome]
MQTALGFFQGLTKHRSFFLLLFITLAQFFQLVTQKIPELIGRVQLGFYPAQALCGFLERFPEPRSLLLHSLITLAEGLKLFLLQSALLCGGTKLFRQLLFTFQYGFVLGQQRQAALALTLKSRFSRTQPGLELPGASAQLAKLLLHLQQLLLMTVFLRALRLPQLLVLGKLLLQRLPLLCELLLKRGLGIRQLFAERRADLHNLASERLTGLCKLLLQLGQRLRLLLVQRLAQALQLLQMCSLQIFKLLQTGGLGGCQLLPVALTPGCLLLLIALPKRFQFCFTRLQLLSELSAGCGRSLLRFQQRLGMKLPLLLLNLQVPPALFFGFSGQTSSFLFGSGDQPLIFFLPFLLHLRKTCDFHTQLCPLPGQHVQFVLKVLHLDSLLGHMYGGKHRDPGGIQSGMGFGNCPHMLIYITGNLFHIFSAASD